MLTGADSSRPAAIAVDAAGNAVVAGTTSSQDFPVTPDAYSSLLTGAQDVFVTKLNASGSALLYSSYFGTSFYDYSYGVAVDSAGSIYAAGSDAFSADCSGLPTTPGAFQSVAKNNSGLASY